MGQFDETIAPDQGVSLTPVPGLEALSAPNLGIPPALLQGAMPPPPAPMARPTMPQAPQAPAAPGNLQHVISAALLGLAAGLGSRHGGGGVAAGLMQGQQANADQRQQEFKDKQAQFKEQQQEVFRQQQLQDREAQVAAAAQAQREKNLQGALLSIQSDVKKIPDKATYDQRIDGYANLLRGSGYRLDSNWLRQAVPFIAPDQKAKAQEAVAAFFKNPINAQQMKDNPEAVANGSIQFDANGDGVKEIIPLRKLLSMAEMEVVTNEKGQPLAMAPSMQGDNMQVALRAKLNKFRAENHREPDAKEMDALVTEARTPVRDPLAEELARARLADMQNKTAGAAPITEGSSEYRRAQDVAYGRLTLSQLKGLYSGREAKGKETLRAVLDKAEQINPDFNAALFEQGYKFATSPQAQMAMVALDRVEPNIDKLIALSDQWDRSKFPTLNAFLRSGGVQWGNRKIQDFGQLQTIVGDELGPALGVGNASDLKTRIGLELAGGNKGPEAFRSGMLLVKDALANQRRAVIGRMGPYGNQAPAQPAAPTEPAANPGRFVVVQKGPK